jgi:hypothetical protein
MRMKAGPARCTHLGPWQLLVLAERSLCLETGSNLRLLFIIARDMYQNPVSHRECQIPHNFCNYVDTYITINISAIYSS